jgi:hypothetical protein
MAFDCYKGLKPNGSLWIVLFSLCHLSYSAKMDNSFKGTERIGFIPESEYTGKEWLECYRTLSGFGGPKLKDSELLPLLANTVDYSWMRLGMYFLEMISTRAKSWFSWSSYRPGGNFIQYWQHGRTSRYQ